MVRIKVWMLKGSVENFTVVCWKTTSIFFFFLLFSFLFFFFEQKAVIAAAIPFKQSRYICQRTAAQSQDARQTDLHPITHSKK